MKILLLTLLFSFNCLASLVEIQTNAVVRDKKFRAKLETVTLKNLFFPNKFDGVHFRVVKAETEEVITLDDDEFIVLKAATAYYHLNKARDYFIDVQKSKVVAELAPITVRIDITRGYSPLGHFTNKNMEKEFNNAKSIEPSDFREPRRGVEPWNYEMWFRPSKKIHLNDIPNVDNSGAAESSQLLRSIRQSTHMMTLNRFFAMLFRNPNSLNYNSLLQITAASIIVELGYQNFEQLNYALSRKWYWLDTALIPEILYHEYTHIALIDHLSLSHSAPLNEGFADYYASQIAKSPKLAKRIKKYNTFAGKNGNNKKKYKIEYEHNAMSYTDFVFGLLWKLEEKLQNEKMLAKSYNTNDFMRKLLTKVDTSGYIRSDLLEGIHDVCIEMCANSYSSNIKIDLFLIKSGF